MDQTALTNFLSFYDLHFTDQLKISPFFRSKIEEENIFPVSFKAHKGMNDWRPFIYGGIASVAAESGKIRIHISFFLYFVLFHL